MGGRGVKITADTNLLVRVLVQDDAEQARAAQALLSRAALIAVPLPVLCELAWVLKRAYSRGAAETSVNPVRRLGVRVLVDNLSFTQ